MLYDIIMYIPVLCRLNTPFVGAHQPLGQLHGCVTQVVGLTDDEAESLCEVRTRAGRDVL